MQPQVTNRHSSDAHFSVLVDLLFSLVMVMAALVSDRYDTTRISVVTTNQSNPVGSTAESIEQELPTAEVLPDGSILFHDKTMSIDQILQEVKAKDSGEKPRIVLKIHPECLHQVVFGVYHRLQAGGLGIVEEGLIKESEDEKHIENPVADSKEVSRER